MWIHPDPPPSPGESVSSVHDYTDDLYKQIHPASSPGPDESPASASNYTGCRHKGKYLILRTIQSESRESAVHTYHH